MKIPKFSDVGAGAILLGISSLFSRFLGLVRDFIFAKIFGVGLGGGVFALDAYYAAFRIPDFLYSLLIFGAMSAAFIPIYTQLKSKGGLHADIFTSQILNFFLFLLTISSVILWLFAPYVVPFIAPGFDADVLATTIDLTRIMLVSPIFLGLSSVLQGVENSHKKFIGISLAPVVYNLAIIISAILFAPVFGVYALAWGVVIGAFFHFSVQLPGALKTGFKYRLYFSLKGSEFREFIILAIPRMFGMVVSQLGIFVDTIIASLLSLGSLSIYNYALNLQSLPHGVVAISFSVAVFASLSERGLNDNKKKFLDTIRTSTHSILFWVLPAIIGLFLLRTQLVDIVLSGGKFDRDSASMTSVTLGIFVWASFAQSLIPLFARGYYALRETKTPVFIGLFCVGLSMSLSLILTQYYHMPVYALAISAFASSFLNMGLLVYFFSLKLDVSISSFFRVKDFALLAINSGVMGIVLIVLQKIDFGSSLNSVAILSFVGFLTYVSLSKITKTVPSLHGY